MAMGRATMRCGLIWFWMGSGIVRAGSALGHFRWSGRVLIGKLVSGAVGSRLAMGRAGPVLVFVRLVYLGSLWRRGLVMLRYGLFSFGGWSHECCGTGLF